MGAWLWRILIALLALALLGAPAAAAAKKKGKKPAPVITVSNTTNPAAGAFAQSAATCPEGTGLLGGGYAATGYFTNGSNFVSQSLRFEQSTWLVAGQNASLATGSLTAEAYCRRGAPTLTEVRAQVTLPAADMSGYPDGTATATCPPGMQASAGGFAANLIGAGGYSGPLVFASTRSAANAWAVSAMNTYAGLREFSSLAYCAKGSRAGVSSPIVDVTGAGTPVTATTPGCPKLKGKKRKGKKRKKRATSALAGGFITAKPDVGLGPGSSHGVFTFESRRSGTVWRASGNSIGTEPGASRLQATAYCG